MATTKDVYEQIDTKLSALRTSATELNSSLVGVDNSVEVEDDFNELFNLLANIDTWTQENIDRIEKEAALNDFLAEAKVLFAAYSAKIEVVDVTSGYGESYGESDSVGLKVSVEKDGIVAEKVFEKSVLSSGDF